MPFSLVHDQPITVERATYRVDRLGYLYCADCPTKTEVGVEEEISGPYVGGDFHNPDHPSNLCDRCGRNPWEARKTVTYLGSIETMLCKIF